MLFDKGDIIIIKRNVHRKNKREREREMYTEKEKNQKPTVGRVA